MKYITIFENTQVLFIFLLYFFSSNIRKYVWTSICKYIVFQLTFIIHDFQVII